MSKVSFLKAYVARGARCALVAVVIAAAALPSVGVAVAVADEGQTGSGETSLVVHLAETGEYGGTNASGSAANPDNDGDGLGDNLAFTVPIRIDFAASANGELIGPSPSAVYIENESRYSVHVSAMDVDARTDWAIVANALDCQTANAIDLSIGPASDMLDAASYLDKTSVSAPAAWNMTAKASTGVSDRVELSTAGHINNVTAPIADGATFGQIRWYVTPGASS